MNETEIETLNKYLDGASLGYVRTVTAMEALAILARWAIATQATASITVLSPQAVIEKHFGDGPL